MLTYLVELYNRLPKELDKTLAMVMIYLKVFTWWRRVKARRAADGLWPNNRSVPVQRSNLSAHSGDDRGVDRGGDRGGGCGASVAPSQRRSPSPERFFRHEPAGVSEIMGRDDAAPPRDGVPATTSPPSKSPPKSPSKVSVRSPWHAREAALNGAPLSPGARPAPGSAAVASRSFLRPPGSAVAFASDLVTAEGGGDGGGGGGGGAGAGAPPECVLLVFLHETRAVPRGRLSTLTVALAPEDGADASTVSVDVNADWTTNAIVSCPPLAATAAVVLGGVDGAELFAAEVPLPPLARPDEDASSAGLAEPKWYPSTLGAGEARLTVTRLRFRSMAEVGAEHAVAKAEIAELDKDVTRASAKAEALEARVAQLERQNEALRAEADLLRSLADGGGMPGRSPFLPDPGDAESATSASAVAATAASPGAHHVHERVADLTDRYQSRATSLTGSASVAASASAMGKASGYATGRHSAAFASSSSLVGRAAGLGGGTETLMSELDSTVLCGVPPSTFSARPKRLHDLGIRAVVNCCNEYVCTLNTPNVNNKHQQQQQQQ